MYESVKKESEKKTFPQKALEMAGSVSDSESCKWLCLKVRLETGAGSGPRRTFSVGYDLGFSSVCQLFSRGPGTVGEGTVNGSCYFYLGDLGQF